MAGDAAVLRTAAAIVEAQSQQGRPHLMALANRLLALAVQLTPEWQFTSHTRYGTERHHQADEHRAGPSCPCGPRIQWLGRSEK